MKIITEEMKQEAKKIDLKVIDKDLYENAKAVIEIHKLVTGSKPQHTAMDTMRMWAYLDSEKEK